LGRQGGVLAACVVNGVLEFAYALFHVAFCLVGLSLLLERFVAGCCADALLDFAGDLIHFALDLVISHGSTSNFLAPHHRDTFEGYPTNLAEPLPEQRRRANPSDVRRYGGVVQVLDGMLCALEALAQVADGGHHGERG